jgi:uncharacterized protein involved in exopolysaccharide biosynthesis
VVHYSPRVYEARATVDAYAELVRDELVRPTVAEDTDVRLKKIRDTVMTRSYLSDLVAADPDLQLAATEDDLVQRILLGVQIGYRPRGREFQVICQDSSPPRAAMLANSVAGAFVEENRKLRASLAGTTTEALEQLAADSKSKLEEIEARIAELRRRHPLETEGALLLNRQQRNELESQIEENATAQQDLQDQLDLLLGQQEWGSMSQPFVPDPLKEGGAPSGGGKLARARAELEQLRLRYSENHPDVQAKLREIRALEQSGGAEGESVEEPAEEESVASTDILSLQIRAAENALDRLRRDAQELQRRKSRIERQIRSTPGIQQQLNTLMRDRDAARRADGEYQDKIEKARAAQWVEEQQKGSQFQVVQAATPPAAPVWPKPLVVLGVGALAGLLLFVGPVLIHQLLRPIVRSELSLRALTDLPILVRIPSLETGGTARRLRRNRIKNLAYSTVSAAVLALTAALYYLERL